MSYTEIPLPTKGRYGIARKHRQALVLAAQMFVDNDLGDWHIELKDVTSYNAQVWHNKKLLTINSRMIKVADKDMFIGIMYHEIAHALLGKSGHGRKFKDKVYELTGSYEHAGYSSDTAIRAFLTYCKKCDRRGSMNERRTAWCRQCFSTMEVKPNTLKEVIW